MLNADRKPETAKTDMNESEVPRAMKRNIDASKNTEDVLKEIDEYLKKEKKNK